MFKCFSRLFPSYGSSSSLDGREGTPPTPATGKQRRSPPAVQRAEYGKVALEEHGRCCYSLSSPNNTNPSFQIVCPHMTAKLMNEHETNDRFLLSKPDKGTPLLRDALTNVNGATWLRQRGIVQKAFGTNPSSKAIRAKACEAAVACLRRQLEDSWKSASNSARLDIRDLSLNVAVAAIAVAVFGSSDNANDEQLSLEVKQLRTELQTKLKKCFLPDLRSARSRKEELELNAVVVQLVNLIATERHQNKSESHSDPDSTNGTHNLFGCLASCLQGYEGTGSSNDGQTYLTRSEVVCNCHSALLAGTQTVATTLAGCMAHMAEHDGKFQRKPDTAAELKSLARAVANETLRILPPVATLPRCNPDFAIHEHRENQSAFASMPIFPPNSRFIVDTLAMVHLKHLPTHSCVDRDANVGDVDDADASEHGHDDGITSVKETEINTWKFDPDNRRKAGHPAPFGMGKRSCPAGILSLVCISATLECLLEDQWKWRFADEGMSSTGASGKGGWVGETSYAATLRYPNPIVVAFWKAEQQPCQ